MPDDKLSALEKALQLKDEFMRRKKPASGNDTAFGSMDLARSPDCSEEPEPEKKSEPARIKKDDQVTPTQTRFPEDEIVVQRRKRPLNRDRDRDRGWDLDR